MYSASESVETSKKIFESLEPLKANNNLTEISIMSSQSLLHPISAPIFTTAPLENKISRFKVQCVDANVVLPTMTIATSANTLSSSGVGINLENQSGITNSFENTIYGDLNTNNSIFQVPVSSQNLTSNFLTCNSNIGLNNTTHLHPHEFNSTFEHLASELRKVSGVEPPSCTSSTISNVISDLSSHSQINNIHPITPTPSYTSTSHTPNSETVSCLEQKTSGNTIDVNHHLFGLNEKLQALQSEQQQDSFVQLNSVSNFGIGSGGYDSSESTVNDFQKLHHSHQSSVIIPSSTGSNLNRANSLAPLESLYVTQSNCTESIDSSLHQLNAGSNLLLTSSTLNELASALKKVL